jgi:CubicO group peptidase (beta-lactamase class C family)
MTEPDMTDVRSPLSRRSFLTACSAAALVALSNESHATGESVADGRLPASLQPVVARKRKAILAAMKQDDIPGGAVSLVHEGKVVWTEGFGVTDRASARPIDAQTIFSIQSTSKHFTATAIMLAVQNGLLDLDAPITTYLPEFSVHSRFEKDPQQKMTLRLLLSHRAGFTHEAPVGNNYYPASPGFAAHVRSISDTWLRYPVGERFAYSNLGVDLAGYALQKVTGVPFAAWLKTMVFNPLGMSDSTCDTAAYASRTNRAVGHEAPHEKVPLEIPIIPSGGVYVSARDMARYALFHLNAGRAGGKQLLERKLWEEMHSFPRAGHPYGLGVERDQFKFGATVIDDLNHDGGGFGFVSRFSYYPKAGLAWAGFFNKPAAAGYEAFSDSLCGEILERAYGKKTPVPSAQELATVEVSKEAQQSFVGNYLGRGGELFEIRFDNGMLGMKVADKFQKLSFTSPVDAFLTDPSGQVAPMHLEAANDLRPKFLRCSGGPSFGDLDYNDGSADAPGPDKKEWQRYVSDYHMLVWGKPLVTLRVHIKNGYLYLDERKLIVEQEPGLFFSADGEALDFRGEEPTWFSIPVQRAR